MARGAQEGQAREALEEDPLLLVVDDPIVGILPWLAWGLLPYVWSAQASAMVAAGLACAVLAVAVYRGERPRALELADVALFVPLVVVTFVASDGVNNWFEDHADLLSNGGLTIMAVVSLLFGRPFTAPYTEARFPGMDERLMRRLDYFATGAWAVGLAVATGVAAYGEYVLDNPNDLWTGWVLQALPLVLAYNATLWFDRRAVRVAAGDVSRQVTGLQVVRNLVILATPVGVLALLFREAPAWLGWGLVVMGLALFLLLGSLLRRRALVARTPWITEEFDPDEDSPG